jgi:hypothetical protein
VLYRVYRALPGASPNARGGPLFVARERQGAGRHDSPARYGAFYASWSAEGAVAEAVQAFRGREIADDDLELADGSWLTLAAYDDTALGPLADLDEPAVLLAEGWRPSEVASRDRVVTQAMAVSIHAAGGLGLSWWSTLDSRWTNVTLFAERTVMQDVLVLAVSPERLDVGHPALTAAAEHLVIGLARRARRATPRARP